jgi:enamine deaminase RidA (YjgF/YER057c/UK114 family)
MLITSCLRFAPAAQAIKVNNLVYTSGQIPVVPETGA